MVINLEEWKQNKSKNNLTINEKDIDYIKEELKEQLGLWAMGEGHQDCKVTLSNINIDKSESTGVLRSRIENDTHFVNNMIIFFYTNGTEGIEDITIEIMDNDRFNKKRGK